MEMFCISEMKVAADKTIAEVDQKAEVLEEQVLSRQDGKSVFGYALGFTFSGLLVAALCVFVGFFWNSITQIVGSPLVNVCAILSAILLIGAIVLRNVMSLLYYKKIFGYRKEVAAIRSHLASYRYRLDGICAEMSAAEGGNYPIERPSDVNARIDEISTSISTLEAISTKAMNVICIIIYFVASIAWTFYLTAFFYMPLRDMLVGTFDVVLPGTELSVINVMIGVLAIISSGLQCFPTAWILLYRENKVDNLSILALGFGGLVLWALALVFAGLAFVIWAAAWAIYWIFWALKWVIVGVVVIVVIVLIGAFFNGG